MLGVALKLILCHPVSLKLSSNHGASYSTELIICICQVAFSRKVTCLQYVLTLENKQYLKEICSLTMYVILLYIYLVPQKCKFVNSMPIYCTSSLVPVYKKQSDVLILQFILVTYKKEKPTRQTKHQSILTKKKRKNYCSSPRAGEQMQEKKSKKQLQFTSPRVKLQKKNELQNNFCSSFCKPRRFIV